MNAVAALFFALFALVLVWKRVELAQLQGLVAGGRITPGCVIAEAVVLVVLGAVIYFAAV
jgi:hypothetical protein